MIPKGEKRGYIPQTMEGQCVQEVAKSMEAFVMSYLNYWDNISD